MPALAFSKMGSCLMGGGVSSWAELIGMQMVKILFLFYIDLCGRDKWYFYICVFGKWCPNRTCISLSEAIEQVLSEGVGFLNRPISGCPSRPTLLDSVQPHRSLVRTFYASFELGNQGFFNMFNTSFKSKGLFYAIQNYNNAQRSDFA